MKPQLKDTLHFGILAAVTIAHRAAAGIGKPAQKSRYRHSCGAMPRMAKPAERRRQWDAQNFFQRRAAKEKLERLAANNAIANAAQRERQRARVAAGRGKTYRNLKALSDLTGQDAVGSFLRGHQPAN